MLSLKILTEKFEGGFETTRRKKQCEQHLIQFINKMKIFSISKQSEFHILGDIYNTIRY